tara:strand:- start:1043 stop:1579 length:537 start_codon:yes stop_codon:yes gene_type:complete
MSSRSYNKFIKYSNLNEISKFSNFNNFLLVSNVKKVLVWFTVDLSVEKSRLVYYSKGLLGIFLIFLITNKFPIVQSSKDQRLLYVESELSSSYLTDFLEKFLIIYNSKQRKNLTKNFGIKGNFIRLLVTDLNLFTEFSGFIHFFSLIELLYVDIYCNHEEDYRNFIFLENLFKSSYFI